MDEIYVLCIILILLPDMDNDGQKYYWCFIFLTDANVENAKQNYYVQLESIVAVGSLGKPLEGLDLKD